MRTLKALAAIVICNFNLGHGVGTVLGCHFPGHSLPWEWLQCRPSTAGSGLRSLTFNPEAWVDDSQEVGLFSFVLHVRPAVTSSSTCQPWLNLPVAPLTDLTDCKSGALPLGLAQNPLWVPREASW